LETTAITDDETSDFWLTSLNAKERSTLTATFAGWMLDGLDVMVYSFVLPSLIALWHISKGQAGLLNTSTLVLSAVGGWIAGLVADRFGRVRVLQVTIVWFAVFTFLSGFANNFTTLFILRGFQGLGFGGEWAVGSVLVGETIRAKWRGRAVGVTQGGWAIGWAIAAGAYAVFSNYLPAHLAWRAMFWLGLLPALLAVWIRSHVTESDIYSSQRTAKPATSSAFSIFSPALLKTTVLASVVALGAQGGYYSINTWLPLYLNSRGLSVTHTTVYLMVVIAGSFTGYITSAHFADWIGRRWTLAIFAIGALITVLVYAMFPISNTATLILGFPLGFFPSGSFSPMGAFFTELFPTSLRGSGQGFCYNLGRGVGAVFPALVGSWSNHIGMGRAIAMFAAGAYLLMVMSIMLLPETRNRELETSVG
jgi:MFS family permease